MSDQQTPRYGHAPVPMTRRGCEGDVDAVGDFAWKFGADRDRRFLIVALPRPRPEAPKDYVLNCLPVQAGPNTPGKWWGWDGNEESPTLTPSVHCIGHWHGWVRGGTLVEA